MRGDVREFVSNVTCQCCHRLSGRVRSKRSLLAPLLVTRGPNAHNWNDTHFSHALNMKSRQHVVFAVIL